MPTNTERSLRKTCSRVHTTSDWDVSSPDGLDIVSIPILLIDSSVQFQKRQNVQITKISLFF